MIPPIRRADACLSVFGADHVGENLARHLCQLPRQTVRFGILDVERQAAPRLLCLIDCESCERWNHGSTIEYDKDVYRFVKWEVKTFTAVVPRSEPRVVPPCCILGPVRRSYM